eukprot:GHVS01000211.1.p1 GENE.GHVS01000211.1~~GHVS01000211.1.p1  ORF type:complete len:175 (+),score=24.06 GHVS01000211.1:403-927(+)
MASSIMRPKMASCLFAPVLNCSFVFPRSPPGHVAYYSCTSKPAVELQKGNNNNHNVSSSAGKKDEGVNNFTLFRSTREAEPKADVSVKVTRGRAGGSTTVVSVASELLTKEQSAKTDNIVAGEEANKPAFSSQQLPQTGKDVPNSKNGNRKFHTCIGEFDVTWDDLMEHKFHGC